MEYDFCVKNYSGNTSIQISGSKGLEEFLFGFSVDIFKDPIFINNNGVLFGAAEATADPFFFVCVYGNGGFSERFSGGNGLAWVSANGAMMSLGWPSCSFIPNGNGSPCTTIITAIDLDEHGVASGKIDYRWDNGYKQAVIKKWTTSTSLFTPQLKNIR